MHLTEPTFFPDGKIHPEGWEPKEFTDGSRLILAGLKYVLATQPLTAEVREEIRGLIEKGERLLSNAGPESPITPTKENT
jgi:hypothetical protein